MVKVRYEKESGKIVAGNITKAGGFGSHFNEVTDEAVGAVFKYIVCMKTTTDMAEILELDEPVLKHGLKKYKVQIVLTPVE